MVGVVRKIGKRSINTDHIQNQTRRLKTTTDAMNASQVQALLNVMEVMDVDVTNGS